MNNNNLDSVRQCGILVLINKQVNKQYTFTQTKYEVNKII